MQSLIPKIWAENSENFNKIGDLTRTISSGKTEFANVVELLTLFEFSTTSRYLVD